MNRRNMNQQSRFGPSPFSSDDRFNEPLELNLARNFPSRNIFQSATPSLTTEQIAFEKEFKKWEEGFETWKKAYASHPDRDAYRQYESKFLDVRVKLMEKRAQIYGKNVLEAVLETQFDAASRAAESILAKFSEPKNDRFGSQQEGFRGRPDRSLSPYFNRSPPRQDVGRSRWDSGSGNNSFDNLGGSPFSGSGSMMGSNRFNSNSGYNSGGNPFNNFSESPFNSSGGNRFNAGNNFNLGNNSSGGRFNSSGGYSFNSAARGKPFQQQNRGISGQRQDRNVPRGSDRKNFKSAQNNRKKVPPMTEPQLKEELERKDVYPFNSWVPAKAPKLALVGKRRKVKNNKITNVLQRIASGEYNPCSDQEREEPESATRAPKMSGAARRKFKLLINKDESEWAEADKIFMADMQNRRAERAKIFGESDPPDTLESFTDPSDVAMIFTADTSDGNNYSSDQMV